VVAGAGGQREPAVRRVNGSRQPFISTPRNAAYEDRMMVTSNKDHANDFADRMEAWIRVMVQIMEEGGSGAAGHA